MRNTKWQWIAKESCAVVAALSTSFSVIHFGVFTEYGFVVVVAIFLGTFWLVEMLCDSVTGRNHE